MVVELVREHSNIPDDDVTVGWSVYRLQPGVPRRDAHQAQYIVFEHFKNFYISQQNFQVRIVSWKCRGADLISGTSGK